MEERLNNIITGVTFLFSGVKIMISKGFKRFILIPLIVNTIIFTTIIVLTGTQLWTYFNSLTSDFPIWAIYVLAWLMWIIYAIACALLTATLFVFVTNFIAAPFYGFLAEKTEYKLGKEKKSKNKGKSKSSGRMKIEPAFFKEALTLIPRTILRELRKWLYFIPWMLLGAVLFIFPLTLPLAPLIWFLIMSWIIAIEFLDYTADNQSKPFGYMIKAVKQEPLTILGFGAIISILISIPGLNLLVPPAAVAGGCKLWLYIENKRKAIKN